MLINILIKILEFIVILDLKANLIYSIYFNLLS